MKRITVATFLALTFIAAPSYAATLSRVNYAGRPAFRLSDGRTQAVIVPEIGRVMSYGFVGGPNLLWNAAPGAVKPDAAYHNWGGDKTWLAPQTFWLATQPKQWPPDPAWDGLAHRAEALPGARLRTVGPLSAATGTRVIREYRFDENGDFVIAQTVDKERGAARLHSIWSDTQAVWPDAVFLPLAPGSAYKNGFYWMMPPQKSELAPLSPTLLMVRPAPGVNFKIGADAPVAAIASVKDGVAWVQRAARSDAPYPDGASGAGFPVELFNAGKSDQAASRYVELELLSPLRPFRAGAKWTHTVRWSLHRLSSTDVADPTLQREIERLLNDRTA